MSLKTMCLMSLCLLAGLTGCATKEKLDIFHRGNDIVQRHFIPGDWDIPPSTTENLCVEEKMVWSTFWNKNVCPGELEKNAPLSVHVAHVSGASYRDLVIPATISGAFQVAAFGTLGAVMPKPHVNVQQTTNALPGARFSTGYFNSTPAPSWLGQ